MGALLLGELPVLATLATQLTSSIGKNRGAHVACSLGRQRRNHHAYFCNPSNRIHRLGACAFAILGRLLSPLHYALALTCFATALLASEILALRWDDVLWDESRIRISKRRAKGTDRETKTEASNGYVPLHPLLAERLKDWHT